MTLRSTVAVALVTAAALAGGAGVAQQRPLPERDAFFAATRENLSRAEREQDHYAYKERRTDLHVNPFGSRVGTDGSRVYEVTPIEPGVWSRRLIERDGKPVTDAKPERQDRRERRQQASGRSTIDDIVQVLDFRIDRRETIDGRDLIVVTFAPRPNAVAQTREGRLAANFKGSIWIDEQAREVTRADAVAIDDLSFGWGMVARLNEGTRTTLTREMFDGGVWLPTSLRFVGNGRALLFRKLTIDYAINWFDYRKVR